MNQYGMRRHRGNRQVGVLMLELGSYVGFPHINQSLLGGIETLHLIFLSI
jgi:hypothetical protein